MSGPNDSPGNREAQSGQNEGVARAVNEEIIRLNERFGLTSTSEIWIICECDTMSCLEQIPILSAEYDRVRADPTLFVLIPGHQDLTVEVVAEAPNTAAYLVVRKPLGTPAEEAAAAASAQTRVRAARLRTHTK